MGSTLSHPITAQYLERKRNQNIEIGLATMQGWRVKHEDTHSISLDMKIGNIPVISSRLSEAEPLELENSQLIPFGRLIGTGGPEKEKDDDVTCSMSTMHTNSGFEESGPLNAIHISEDLISNSEGANKNNSGLIDPVTSALIQQPVSSVGGLNKSLLVTGSDLISIFDGHSGRSAAEAVASDLHECLSRNFTRVKHRILPESTSIVETNTYPTIYEEDLVSKLIEYTFVMGYIECDRSIRSRSLEGGAAAVSSWIRRSKNEKEYIVTLAHSGDSRACIFSSNWELIYGTTDHKPDNERERSRIQAAGGYVTQVNKNGPPRLCGVLSLSRGFGDFLFKQKETLSVATQPITSAQHHNIDNGSKNPGEMCHSYSIDYIARLLGESPLVEHHRNQKFSIVPDVYSVRVPVGSFLVMGCDGIFDVISNKDLGETIRSQINQTNWPCNSIELTGDFSSGIGDPDLAISAARVIDKCLKIGSKDNMTCLIALLEGSPVDENHRSLFEQRVLSPHLLDARVDTEITIDDLKSDLDSCESAVVDNCQVDLWPVQPDSTKMGVHPIIDIDTPGMKNAGVEIQMNITQKHSRILAKESAITPKCCTSTHCNDGVEQIKDPAKTPPVQRGGYPPSCSEDEMILGDYGHTIFPHIDFGVGYGDSRKNESRKDEQHNTLPPDILLKYRKFFALCGYDSNPDPCKKCGRVFRKYFHCPCNEAVYCGKSCQRLDWKYHRADCSAKKRRA